MMKTTIGEKNSGRNMQHAVLSPAIAEKMQECFVARSTQHGHEGSDSHMQHVKIFFLQESA